MVLLKEWNIAQTNSDACYQWMYALGQAAIRAGYSTEIIYGMAHQLTLAGCASVDQSLEMLDIASDSSAYKTWCESIISVFDLNSLFLLQHEVLTQEQIRALRMRMMIEVLADTFQWKWSLITWLGHKREEGHHSADQRKILA
ncbi:MAG TPA: hypothetical protein VKR06_05885 [Ktedonosporobacter sp.]|nr:hypothetical protein [Ktedonosporobacter sp.]